MKIQRFKHIKIFKNFLKNLLNQINLPNLQLNLTNRCIKLQVFIRHIRPRQNNFNNIWNILVNIPGLYISQCRLEPTIENNNRQNSKIANRKTFLTFCLTFYIWSICVQDLSFRIFQKQQEHRLTEKQTKTSKLMETITTKCQVIVYINFVFFVLSIVYQGYIEDELTLSGSKHDMDEL